MPTTLKVKSVYMLDDSGAYGVGMADAFEKQAEARRASRCSGRDRLDPKAADYTAILTKIKSLNPEAIYYGGVGQAGVKLAKQAYDIIPKMIKGGGDGVVESGHADRRRLPGRTRAGTAPSPRRTSWTITKAAQFVDAYFKARFNDPPTTTPSPPMTRRW